MKRGKDEEKVMGPMFPRLHVNDAEKGGPRAPPRNKMALYEQLSIPSQRFNNGTLPRNPSNSSNLVPAASSSQGSGYGRGMRFQPHASPSHPAERLRTISSDLNTPSGQPENKRNLDDDDFRVPIFVQSGMNQVHSNYHGHNDEHSASNPACLGHSTVTLDSHDMKQNQSEVVNLSLRQEGRMQSEKNSRDTMSGSKQFIEYTSSQSREKPQGLLKQTNSNSRYECGGNLAINNGRVPETNAESQQVHIGGVPIDSIECDIIVSYGCYKNTSNAISPSKRDSQSEEQRIINNSVIDIDSYEDRASRSARTGNVDRDDVSETSIVDSISGLDITPDDVVGIIGQKHFWKARRAIINQQRLFAVQVFELHRLIKVQRLIAGSPHLMIEDNAFLPGPLKGSPTKKLPMESVLKTPSKFGRKKDEPEKLNHNMEGSAENAVKKTSISSLQNGTLPSSTKQFSGNHPPAGFTMDPRFNPWCFQQPPGHHWLVPVMSPSEGLVYKPYPGPEFSSSVCGGCGSPGSTPIMGNFPNPTYGHPTSLHHYPGVGVPSFAPAASHGYFNCSPYGMPIMYPTVSGSSVEQMNHVVAPGSHGQVSSGGEATVNIQHQGASSVSRMNNGTISKKYACRDGETQISTACSPNENAQRVGIISNACGSGNALSLFPASPAINVPDPAPRQHENNQQTRIIKVVPHNARSASASAARIFKSIQEERKQHDTT